MSAMAESKGAIPEPRTPNPDTRAAERLRWRARRGLLENDLLLTRFLDQRLAGMSQDEMEMLDKLLRLDDNDLLDLLMGRVTSTDPGLATLVANIRSAEPGPTQA